MLKEINNWKDAPLWTPKKIKKQQKHGLAFKKHDIKRKS